MSDPAPPTLRVPTHLDPALELPLPPSRARDTAAFARAQLPVLAGLGVRPWQARELVAIGLLETAHGSSELVGAHNLVGQKAKADVAAWHERTQGAPLRWVRKKGHPKAKDPPIAVYAAFASDEVCWRLFLDRVVGRGPHERPYMGIYRVAGARFWAGDASWFDALLRAGYRGPTTRDDPEGSIAGHRSLVRRVAALEAARG